MPWTSMQFIVKMTFKFEVKKLLQTKEVATVNTEAATVRNCFWLPFVITLYVDIFKIRWTIDSFFFFTKLNIT